MDANKMNIRENGSESTTTSSFDANLFITSPTKIKKKKRTLVGKKKMVPYKSKILKSKDKQVIPEKPEKPEKPTSSKRKRTKVTDVYDDIEAKFSVMERAERVMSSLEGENPSFMKCMLPSNVAYGFWLILPSRFCKLHLPNHDTTIILVDEWENEYKTTFLLDRHGLSAGWRGFSMSHRLLKGDILVFQLTEPCKIKVYIVRVYGLEVVDAALCLMNLDSFRGTTDSDLAKMDNKKRKRPKKYADCYLLDAPKPQVTVVQKSDSSSISTPNLLPATKHSVTNSDGLGSEVLEGPEISNVLHNEVFHSESYFLHEQPLEVVPCR